MKRYLKILSIAQCNKSLIKTQYTVLLITALILANIQLLIIITK